MGKRGDKLAMTGFPALLTPFLCNSIKITLLEVLLLKTYLLTCSRRRKLSGLPRVVVCALQLALALVSYFALCVGGHYLYLHMEAKPHWLWTTHVWEAALVALDAETGEYRWTWTPPPFAYLAAA